MLLLCIVWPSNNEINTCSQNVSIGLFTTSYLDLHSEWNDQACVVNHVVYWEQYICPTPASVLFNYGHYTSMIEKMVYLPCHHHSCVIDGGNSGIMYLKRQQRFFRKLLHLLRKRQWCKRNFQLMHAFSILLLLGEDVELNPGPHQIVLIRCYGSLSKLSTTDEKHLSGLGIPDLHMDFVCHVAVNLSGLSVPDCNMDYVCHVTMKLPGLNVPDVHMEYGCLIQKIEMEIEGVPTCQEQCCKRDIQLAHMPTHTMLLTHMHTYYATNTNAYTHTQTPT